jgi:uncharacterized membrane protein YbhN (UPF0104 family)
MRERTGESSVPDGLKKIPAAYRRLLKLLLTALLLGYVIYTLAEQRQQLSSLRQLSIVMFVWLLGLTGVSVFIHAIRFRMVVEKKSGLGLPLGAWMKFFIIARFLSFYAGQAGNLYRAVKLKQDHHISLTKYISSTLFLVWFDTCLGLLFGMAVIGLFAPHLRLFGMPALLLILIFLCLLGASPFLFHRTLSFFSFRGRFLNWAHGRFSEMSASILDSLGDPVFLFKLGATGIIFYIHSTAVLYFTFRGLGIPAGPAAAALFFTVLTLFNQIVITPGNLGFKEIAYGILAHELAIGMAQGILVSLITRLLALVVTTVLGLAVGGSDLLDSFRTRDKRRSDETEMKIGPGN